MIKMLKTLVFAVTLIFSPIILADKYIDKNILISAQEAIKLVGNKNVMFVSGDNADVYKLGHIKGSVEMYAHHLHHSDITGNMHCAPLYRCLDDAEAYIGSKGISNDMMIIAYDEYKGVNATGVYSFFTSYGHKNIKILNGGRAAIMEIDPGNIKYNTIKAELRVEKRASKPARKKLKKVKRGRIKLNEADIAALKATIKTSEAKQKSLKAKMKAQEKKLIVVKGAEHIEAKTYKIFKESLDFSNIASKDEVKHAMQDILKKGKDSKFVIIDARSMAEIIGERKMDNVARGGHIPGAIFVEWRHVSDLKNKKPFKSAKELKALYNKLGITKDKTIYAYCMVGAGRSSQHIVALKLLGYKNIKVFTGSWDVWGNDMNLPLKR